MMQLQTAKQRYGIIGNSFGLNRAIETCLQVAPTELSVLITGESGVGKESLPKIIHAGSARKHNKYIAVNCGAIPAGTMDSELFGHVKGAFTGAQSERKGYFEEADGGTLFLDEVAEMPLETQVKLLRVLEAGEFIKVGSSKVQKTDVRIIAATNVNVVEAIKKNKFREDLFYRLNTVPVTLPPLRERREDIHLIFRKFASDFADKFKMPAIRLTDDAAELLEEYNWPGNIRQLKNITEQLSILEQTRMVTKDVLLSYLPEYGEGGVPALADAKDSDVSWYKEREMLYNFIFELRNELDNLKTVVRNFLNRDGELTGETPSTGDEFYSSDLSDGQSVRKFLSLPAASGDSVRQERTRHEALKAEIAADDDYQNEEIEETLNLEQHERKLIEKALEKHNNKRKTAAKELGVSERTLYRKIKEYDL